MQPFHVSWSSNKVIVSVIEKKWWILCVFILSYRFSFKLNFIPEWNFTGFIPGWNSLVNRIFFIQGRVSSRDEVLYRLHVNILLEQNSWNLDPLFHKFSWNIPTIKKPNSNFSSRFFEIFSTHSMLLVSFYTPWKHQKTSGFLMFSRGVEKTSGIKSVNLNWLFVFFSTNNIFFCFINDICSEINKFYILSLLNFLFYQRNLCWDVYKVFVECQSWSKQT